MIVDYGDQLLFFPNERKSAVAKGARFIRWGLPSPAMAEKTLKAFAEATEYWKKQQAEKMIDGFEAVFLDYIGGDLAGFLVIRGDRDKLNQIRQAFTCRR